MKRQTLMSHNKELWSKIKPELNTNKRLLVLAATGTGKSFIAGRVVQYLRAYKSVIGRVIVIVNSISTIDQWKNVFGITEFNDHLINFISYAKLSRSDMDFEEIENARIIIADEVHHIGSKGARRIFSHISEDTYVLGLTADSKRYSDQDVSDVSIFFDKTINGLSVDEAIESGVLNEVEYHVGLFALKEEELKKLKTKISKRAIESQKEMLLKNLDTFSSAEYMKATLDKHLPERVKGIIFVQTYADIKETEVLFRGMYPEASIYTISSNYSNRKYDSNLEGFKHDTSDMVFMISVDVMNEGHHISGANVCIFLRKTKSMQIYNQQFGRILSSSNDFTAYCFDFVNNINTLEEVMEKIQTSIDDINIKSGQVSNTKEGDKRAYSKRQIYRIQYMIDSELVDFVKKIKSLGYTAWKDWEDEIIKTRYPSEGIKIAKDLPGRSKDAIRARAKLFGINNTLRWEQWEDNIIKTRYPSEGINISKGLPGRSKQSIRARARAIGVSNTVKRWEQWEDNIIRSRYPSEGIKIAKDLPGRSKDAIRARAKLFGINNTLRWEQWEDDIIKTRYPSEGTNISKDLPGRSKQSIVTRAGILEVKSSRCWEQWEDNIIRYRYPSEGIKIAKDLPGRSKDAIRGRAQVLGIKYKRV